MARAMRVMVVDVGGVDRGGVAEAVLHAHRQVDGGVDVAHAHDRQHRHHLLGPGQAVLARHVGHEQARLGLRLHADLGQDRAAASLPIQAGFITPGLLGGPSSLKMTRSSASARAP